MKAITDNIRAILALIVVNSCILFIYLDRFLEHKNGDSQGLMALVSMANLAIGYYWGNITGQAKKEAEKDKEISELKNKLNA